MTGPIKEEQEKAAHTQRSPEGGYGACSHSGCNCPAYEGSGDTCGNCGHNYSYHW
jgi:hypothetical protein